MVILASLRCFPAFLMVRHCCKTGQWVFAVSCLHNYFTKLCACGPWQLLLLLGQPRIVAVRRSEALQYHLYTDYWLLAVFLEKLYSLPLFRAAYEVVYYDGFVVLWRV